MCRGWLGCDQNGQMRVNRKLPFSLEMTFLDTFIAKALGGANIDALLGTEGGGFEPPRIVFEYDRPNIAQVCRAY